MGLLSTDKVARLQKQSEDALGIIHTTLGKLSGTNKAIRQAKAVEIEEINKRQAKVNIYDEMEKGNEKFIAKLNAFLEE
jgi:hypothetical protein